MHRSALVLAFALSGCMPFALPPSRVSLGSGPAGGGLARSEDVLHPTVVTSLRGGIHPMGLLEGASDRSFDLGAGYQLDLITGETRPSAPAEPAAGGSRAHGPYLEGAYYPVRGRVGNGTFLRFGGRSNADLLFLNPDLRVGFGGTGVAELELATDVAGPFAAADSDSVVLGAQKGQWALGVFAGGEVRSFRAGSYGGFTGGVSLRIPLMAGVICCAWPSGSSKDHHAQPKVVHRHSVRDP